MKHRLCRTGIVVVCFLATLLCGCDEKLPIPDTPHTVHVDNMMFTEEQLIKYYPHLIQGTVTKVKRIALPDSLSDDPHAKGIDTLTYVRVEKTLNGNIPENKTIIVFLNGDGENYYSSDVDDSGGYFSEGDKVLLFLLEHTEDWITYYKKGNPKQYRKDKMVPYHCNVEQARFWLDEEGNILHDRNPFGYTLFQDCATVDELVEKYGLN